MVILQESQSAVAIAVAAHDLGEYVRYYPRGKRYSGGRRGEGGGVGGGEGRKEVGGGRREEGGGFNHATLVWRKWMPNVTADEIIDKSCLTIADLILCHSKHDSSKKVS